MRTRLDHVAICARAQGFFDHVGGAVFAHEEDFGRGRRTTAEGGNAGTCGGCGTVFKLSPASDGKWTKTLLHQFGGADGAFPLGDLIFDGAGNILSTTQYGGTYADGTVFEIAQ